MLEKNKGIIDRYGIQLAGVCPCVNCEKRKFDVAYSCEIYKEECNIPTTIWRGKKKCEYYTIKHSSK